MNEDISNHSGPGSAAEPSMEEILASIRRILKEDDSSSALREDPEDDELVLSSAMVAVPADISTATELPAETGPLGAHDEVRAAEYHEPVHFVSEPELDTHVFDAEPQPAAPEPAAPELAAPEPAAPELAAPEPAAPEEVLEEVPMTLAAEPPPPPAPWLAAPEPEPEPVFATAPPPAPAPVFVAPPPPPAPVFVAAPPPPAAPMPAAPMPAAPQHEEHYMEQHVQGPDGLIGEVTTSAISSTVGQLLRSITTDRTVAVSRGGLTIEDIVREEIKPMLKAWFDSHLPSLVERIVRAEIGRVIDRMEL